MRIFFSAGEPSGDQHAAHLIKELNARHVDFQPEGFGGPHMRDEGCKLHFELTELAVMGFLAVVPMIMKFRQLVIQAENHFDQSRPDAVVLVNFSGFNWWIAKAAKKRGIPVYFYMPPQLWAWAPWRIRRVRKWVDHVICNLPFEYEWYKSRNVKATWVGHPFFDEVAARKLDADLVAELQNRDPAQRLIGVLPGSRRHEVERNFPVMLDVIRTVNAAVPNVRWVVGNYIEQHTQMCRQLQADANIDADLTYYIDRTSEVIEAAECCLMVSGSISLELLARTTPGVVLYRAARLPRLVARVMQTCRFITLTNLVADEELMPEYISAGDPTKHIQAMAGHLTDWCLRPETLQDRRQRISDLADQAAIPGATQRTADLLLSELTTNGTATADSSIAA
ncbi:MAG: lipid-A-disaccharide synthase [Planctomycetaceae bacterium]